MNSNFMQHENFISNKENLNGFEDTMDEPMDIDPSTPYNNKMRPVNMRQQQDLDQLANDGLNNELKEQQQLANGPKIVKSVNGPKIVKPIRPAVNVPKVIRPNGLPQPLINNENEEDFEDIDPFKTKSKIGFDTTEFQSPGGFNLRLSDETINEDMKTFSMEEQDPFKTKSNIMDSPVRTSPPKSNSNLFKSPPPPPIFGNDDLNQNIDDLNNSTHSQQTNGDVNSLHDEWETHQKRSSSNRSLNNSLIKQNKCSVKQPNSAVSSSNDLSSSENITSSPPLPNKNRMLGLSTSSSESTSEHTSAYSSNTASTSSMNNNKNNELCESEINENLAAKLDPSKTVWNNNSQEDKSNEPPTIDETVYSTPIAMNPDLTPVTVAMTNDKPPMNEHPNNNNQIDNEVMLNLKQNNFIGSSRYDSTTPNCEQQANHQLLDFSDENYKPVEITEQTGVNENDKAVENVVFDSIFSSDTDFNSFLDLLEKKEVDNSIKQSPKYSEFARKSLYIQFDPITQLNLSSSLSPEKVKRLSLIVDKKNAIKNYLCDIAKDTIAEDENELDSQAATDEIQPSINELSNVTSTEPLVKVDDLKSEKLIEINEAKPVKEEKTDEKEEIAEKILPKSDMIITNNKMGLIDKNTVNFNEKLVLTDDDNLDKLSSNGDDYEEACETLNKDQVDFKKNENDLIVNKKPGVVEEILTMERNTKNPNMSVLDLETSVFKTPHNDTSFKLMTEDSMMLDESGLIPSRNLIPPSEKNKRNSTNAKNSSTEDLSSSSVCISSASNQEMANLVKEVNELREREKHHLQRIDSLEEENDKFKTVAIDFEEIFKNLITDKEESEVKLKNEIMELTKERDHLQEDVIGVERAFDDLHRRFEKLKTKVEEFKRNEDSLQNAIEVYKQQLEKEKMKYSTLKRHAEEKIEFANSEIEKVRKSSAVELQRLSAELRKAEIKISSLDLSVQQKDQENSQLTNLLEDLLQKVKPTDGH